MASDAWTLIDRHPVESLESLFAGDGDRLARLSHDVCSILFDWSKTHLDEPLLTMFARLAEERSLAEARDELFSGAIVNPTEGRAAEHGAERGGGSPDAVETAAVRRARMRSLLDAIDGDAFGEVQSVLHIGIGGSVLGPDLLVDALGRGGRKVEARFLSNIDGLAFEEAIAGLDPAATLLVVVSKTFTTAETLANMEAALRWLREAGVGDPFGRVIAVTASPEAALAAGIDDTRILQFSESVGGRYSLWSAVGVTAALALGWDAFEELLEGAAEMDRHFRFTEPLRNVPMIAAFSDQFYVRRMGCQTRAVFAYDERLRLLVPYLQQLEMESNGKSVTLAGDPVDGPTAPVTWGGTGTDAQHAVFQLLHQGTVLIPAEFVAVAEAEDRQDPEHHRQLLLNAFAQGAALMAGRASDDPHRSYAGNRPSATVLLDRLDARALGALIAFYEHRTFTNAVLMGINPFDQFGVELGKAIANQLSDESAGGSFDPSTRALMERAGI